MPVSFIAHVSINSGVFHKLPRENLSMAVEVKKKKYIYIYIIKLNLKKKKKKNLSTGMYLFRKQVQRRNLKA